MPQLRPERFGNIPPGLSPYHYEFLRKVRDALEILMGANRQQTDRSATPRSQAVTFGDLDSLGISSTTANNTYSRVFMHMGAP